MAQLFDLSGTWYKANLHTHTTRSDGKKTPEETCRAYRDAGYDFLALTDHRVGGCGGTFEDMVLVPGSEWNIGWDRSYPVYHILALGTESDLGLADLYAEKVLPNSDVISPQELIDRIQKAGGLAVLGHPAWSLTNPYEVEKLHGLTAAEIYNSVSAAPWNPDRADSSLYFDLWAKDGVYMPCTAADDTHFWTGEQCYSYTMVNAKEKTVPALMEALKNGNFYASQGPRFTSVEYDDTHIVAKFSEDVKRVIFYSNMVYVKNRVVTEPNGMAEYEIRPNDTYIRIEIMDAEGRKAWTSPFPVRK